MVQIGQPKQYQYFVEDEIKTASQLTGQRRHIHNYLHHTQLCQPHQEPSWRTHWEGSSNRTIIQYFEEDIECESQCLNLEQELGDTAALLSSLQICDPALQSV